MTASSLYQPNKKIPGNRWPVHDEARSRSRLECLNAKRSHPNDPYFRRSDDAEPQRRAYEVANGFANGIPSAQRTGGPMCSLPRPEPATLFYIFYGSLHRTPWVRKFRPTQLIAMTNDASGYWLNDDPDKIPIDFWPRSMIGELSSTHRPMCRTDFSLSAPIRIGGNIPSIRRQTPMLRLDVAGKLHANGLSVENRLYR